MSYKNFLSTLRDMFIGSLISATIAIFAGAIIATFWQPIFMLISIITFFFVCLGWWGYFYLFIGAFVLAFLYSLYDSYWDEFKLIFADPINR